MDTTHAPLVLIVDDEDDVRATYREALLHEGYRVIEAKNGQEGSRVAFDARPDAILSDNIMPQESGIAMIAHIRQDAWGAKVPVVLLTSSYNMDAINEILALGNMDYLVKSESSTEDVVTALRRRLKK